MAGKTDKGRLNPITMSEAKQKTPLQAPMIRGLFVGKPKKETVREFVAQTRAAADSFALRLRVVPSRFVAWIPASAGMTVWELPPSFRASLPSPVFRVSFSFSVIPGERSETRNP